MKGAHVVPALLVACLAVAVTSEVASLHRSRRTGESGLDSWPNHGPMISGTFRKYLALLIRRSR